MEENRGGYNNNPNGKTPGRELAIIAVVLGGVSCALAWLVGWFLPWLCPAAILFGAAGTVLAVKAKKAGERSALVSTGLILSLAGLAGGVIILVSCSAFAVWISCVRSISSSLFSY